MSCDIEQGQHTNLIRWSAALEAYALALKADYSEEIGALIQKISQEIKQSITAPLEPVKPAKTLHEIMHEGEPTRAPEEELDKNAEESSCPMEPVTLENPIVNSKNKNAWTDEEIAVIKSAVKVEDAVKYYKRQFLNKRDFNGIKQKWQKLRREGRLILKGSAVTLNLPGSIYNGKKGVVKSFTDSRTSATVEYENNTQIQCSLQYLETAQ